MSRFVPGALAISLLVSSRAARADAPAFTIGSRPLWYLLGGITSGGTVALADRGGFVGAELSLARLRDGNYAGVYADGYYDFGVGGTYTTGGIEVGHGPFGLDGGVAIRRADGARDVGPAVRLCASLGVFGICVRYMHFDAMTDDDVLQVGAVVKLPLVSPFGGR